MSNAEDPAAKIAAGTAQLQMAKERQEGLLDDLLAIVNGYTKGEAVAQKRSAKLLKKRDDLDFGP